MKYIKKITDAGEFNLKKEDFTFSEEKVQGAITGKNGGAAYVISPRRFKLYTDGVDKLKIVSLSGSGHFKWSRGETDFSEGDIFEISSVGEYEVNGNAEFIVVRK